MHWLGAENCVSCQHIHMSSLFRHTLENVTSFQAWPGKRSAKGKRKTRIVANLRHEAASHCVHALMRALMTHYSANVCVQECSSETLVLASQQLTCKTDDL
ncbi:hypothetical protein ILYODFUR_017186 [Ilyodon furcidens]|uniref:Uncharacterized protein n=1 Tax=Ilyodon furcidens TaxID=33524 RepID=A0ABV0T8S1_9TELE